MRDVLLRAALVAAIASVPVVAVGQRGKRPPPKPAPAPVAADPVRELPPDPHTLPGWALYDRFCLACHGVKGDGAGPAAAWLEPRPRDFTLATFKWVSTGDPANPSRADLAEVIRLGAPGTAMHPFGGALDEAAIDQLVDVVRAFAGYTAGSFELGSRGRYVLPIRLGAEATAQLERGQAMYQQLGCVACHGAGGKGDGPSAAGLKDAAGQPHPPFDLTAGPARRPREPGEDTEAVLTSILWGVGGTAMPGFDGAAPLDDLMALAVYVASLAPAPADGIPDLAAATIARDKASRATEAGYRPGAAGDPDGALFGGVIALQGTPPAGLTPAQASLSSRQCGRCHAKQVREWTGSIHAAAGSAGLIAQLPGFDAAEVESCQRCHAPLAEQQPTVRPQQELGATAASGAYRASPFFDPGLRDEGLTCAACHVRSFMRHGPPRRAPSLLSLPGYPITELAVYERADFCVGCHQLPPRLAIAGRPLLDTYREWLLGPYMRRGVQCQHCHMPNREHTWKGVHDPETFRQGIAVTAIAGRAPTGVVSVRARLVNIGAGHYLPTTPTPAAWLEIELIDRDGTPGGGAHAERRIGRHIRFDGKKFVQLEDTRVPPGGAIELAQGWRGGRVADAVAARVRVRVRPDDYYEGFYQARLRGKLDPAARALYEQALARAQRSPYVAYEQTFPLALQ